MVVMPAQENESTHNAKTIKDSQLKIAVTQNKIEKPVRIHECTNLQDQDIVTPQDSSLPSSFHT